MWIKLAQKISFNQGDNLMNCLPCPKCKSSEVMKFGMKMLKLGTKVQRFQCKICGHIWHEINPDETKKFEIGKCGICYKPILNVQDFVDDGEMGCLHRNCMIRNVEKDAEEAQRMTTETPERLSKEGEQMRKDLFDWILRRYNLTDGQYNLLDKKKRESYVTEYLNR